MEWNILSNLDITFNAEVSDSLGIDSLFSVGFIAWAAVGVAENILSNIGGGGDWGELVNTGLEECGGLDSWSETTAQVVFAVAPV